MKRLMVLGTVWALAVARPELYKEKEDFQFSRSSSDDGTKSGFYGAQRGNMGGNFERAHNMDSLAQNQMSGVVRQVDGELGDGAQTKTGSVYSAANSRGTYGSGHFDTSNLGGRNFQESSSYGDSQSQASRSAASAYNAAAYANSQSQSSRHSGYQAAGHSGLNLHTDDLQALDQTQGAGQYDYGRQTSHAAGYNAQSGFQQHAAYDTSNTNLHSGGYGSNVQTRLISATPVRVIVRPGTRVAIPVAAQTYDLTHGSSLIDQNSLISDAEVLSADNQRTVYRPNNAKHYESSYNYRKEWEKHDTIPATVIISPTSTDNPFSRNSELYEDSQARTASDQYDTHTADSQRAHSAYGGYNANVKSTSGQSRFNYDTQRNRASHTNANAYSVAGYGTNHQETSSDSSLNAYNIQSQYNDGRHHGVAAGALTQAAVHNTGVDADLNSQVENLNTKPKSYQSAYSYHKSWERQGDPYVIKPASSAYYDGQSSQRLSTGSTQNLGYLATGSHYQHSHASGADCDENGHIRVARSYNTDQFQDTQQRSQNLEDLGQQQQNQNLEDFGQQQQSQNLEDFGQQQQSQNLEDLGQQQQSQNLEDFGQQQQSQNLEDFGQQQQNQNLDNFSQQQQSQKLEDLGQPQHKQYLEDLGQQVENLGQQAEVVWDSQQEAGQQARNTWDKFEDLGQKRQDIDKQLSNVEQNNQNNLGQRTQDTETKLKNYPQDQQVQDKLSFNYKSQDDQKNSNTQDKDHDQSNKFSQQETQPQLSDDDIFNYSQQSRKHNNDQMSVWDKFDYGSDQNVQQNKYNSEHTNSNGNQVVFVTQQTGLDQQPFNSVSKTDKSQSVHHNENNTNTDSYSNVNAFDTISPNTAPLSGLWNKLGNFEQTLLTGNVDKGQGNAFSQVDTRNTYGNSMHAYHNMESASQEHPNSEMKPYHDLIHINEKDLGQVNKSNDTKREKESPLDVGRGDIGRGDIGPEDLSDLKPEKYPSDTPVSSETLQNQDENNVNKNNTNAQHYNRDVHHNENTHRLNNFHQHHDLQEQKYLENTEQQNLHVLPLHENIKPPYPQDSEKQHNLDQHNVQDYEESLEKQNLKKIAQQENDETNERNLQKLGMQDNLEQQNLQDFGQQVNVEQQNLQDFGQQENLEQQNLYDFAKQDNLEQQNSQDFGHQVSVEQQNLQDFGKQDNLEQQNKQDFGQQETLEQQNLHDFGKQDNLEQQNLQDFGQHVNLEQQNFQDFGQKEYFEQQNLHGFEKQDNLEQQNLQDFGQQVNLEQQNSQNLRKQYNLEQQNLQDFGQQVNSEQHNLQYFGSQDNLQQQNKHLEQLSQDSEQPLKYSKEERTTVPVKNNVQSQNNLPPPEVIEQPIVKKQNNDLQSISAQTPITEVSPIESVTKSTGFWKSVGNKFSSAKSKIASWF